MKKITLTFLLLLTANVASTQVTFFNYLNYTSEWRYYGGGWNGIAGYTDYVTRYFDGDAVINGQTYYQFYDSKREITTDFFGNPVVEKTVSGPGYMREAADGKFYSLALDSLLEHEMFDNPSIVNAQMGDAFPYPGATCNVEGIEMLDLGSQALKLITGSVAGTVSWQTGSLEGVGVVGLACAVGIESNGWLSCYTKDGNTIQFGTINCNDFPIPLRVNLATTSFSNNVISISPNPSKDWIELTLNSNNKNHRYTICDLRGSKVLEGDLFDKQMRIDLSQLAAGVYVLRLDDGISKKILKQ